MFHKALNGLVLAAVAVFIAYAYWINQTEKRAIAEFPCNEALRQFELTEKGQAAAGFDPIDVLRVKVADCRQKGL